ncbi:acyltransferase family protein [Acidovorax sp. NCPPB 4044]|uniref:acyltransferase family protein n=1 Tax=Acidovorax sp. NCPPB 4044 TaxID=2940490 RepID=UPI002302D349|nr:acyltransferase [Acidovorax sp. NCPPB 4044]MDA8522452.1 acyltransferase [Acidovorax sp. NCPPB 4044]
MPPTQPRNLFDALRICAAVAVVFSHHFALTRTEPPSWLHSSMVGGVAVMTFFTISGYLVTLSWLREPRVFAFLWKRFLRIWPGVLLAVLTNIFVFGLVFTRLPAAEFLSHPGTIDYYRNLLLYREYVNLPGVFLANPYPQVMNGPLWTIPMETMCYAVLATLGVLGILRSRLAATLAGLAYLGYFLAAQNADFTGEMRHWFEYSAYFTCGALIALHRDAFLARAPQLLCMLAPVGVLLFFGLELEHSAGLVVLPPLLIYLGSRQAAPLPLARRVGDPSYGIYLYGFPIAQAVVALWPALPFGPSLLLTTALAFAAGMASWHLFESPALRLKRWTGAAWPLRTA